MKLTEDQRNKLINREKLNTEFTIEKRRENEFALRNRLKSFLEFIPDANQILYNLPREQLVKNEKLRDVLDDQTVYGVFDLLFQLMSILEFAQASGNPQKPYTVKWEDYKGPFVCGYAPPVQYEEPFDLAREQATLWSKPSKPKDKSYPILKPMTHKDHERNMLINIYIHDLIEHYQSDPVLHAKIHHEWADGAREGRPTNLDKIREKILLAMENAGIGPEEYKHYVNVSEKE